MAKKVAKGFTKGPTGTTKVAKGVFKKPGVPGKKFVFKRKTP